MLLLRKLDQGARTGRDHFRSFGNYVVWLHLTRYEVIPVSEPFETANLDASTSNQHVFVYPEI